VSEANAILPTSSQSRAGLEARPGVEGAEPIRKPEHAGRIRGLVVCCQCDDGSLRSVKFQGKQATKVYGLLKSCHGGLIQLHKEPLQLVEQSRVEELLAIEKAKIAADTAAATEASNSITWWQRFVKRFGPQPSTIDHQPSGEALPTSW
jgi:hypothetical protein